MSVELLAIKFNHDPSSATHDALSIRRNASTFVGVPEWQSGISVNPEDSPAAYALAQVHGNTVTIQARFRRTDPGLASAEVRALDADVDPPGPKGCLGWLLHFFRLLVRALAGNVLGEVAPTAVSFDPTTGLTAFETLQLQNTKLDDGFVSVRTTRWRWQYRVSGGTWTDIEITSHRIYIVLDLPTAPWQQHPYQMSNTALPWTEVLDYACHWSLLAEDPVMAGTRVTERIYALGPATIEYDCPGGGAPHYSGFDFNCTAFIDRLRGGPGNGQYVNCSDCATFTSTFANILGCDLWQSWMEEYFELNPILAIGASAWYPGCPSWSSHQFTFHEVAWTGACGVNDDVYDACLQVDGDVDPSTAPHTPLLAVGMRFGNPGDGDYRDRLATPAGRPNCNPAPWMQQRRTVF